MGVGGPVLLAGGRGCARAVLYARALVLALLAGSRWSELPQPRPGLPPATPFLGYQWLGMFVSASSRDAATNLLNGLHPSGLIAHVNLALTKINPHGGEHVFWELHSALRHLWFSRLPASLQAERFF